MVRYPYGPSSTRISTEPTVRPPPTVAACALFALFPVALVLAASFPVAAISAAAGAAVAELHRRRRTAHRRAATGSAGVASEAARDV